MMDRYNTMSLDAEEKDLISALKSINQSGMKRPPKKTQDKFRRAAKAYVVKESKMNIRIAPTELAQIKARAEEEGLKYQTLVKSVLHKYVTGQLVDKGKKAG
jgi:predicted DNA binding CopG/RHH family protein